MISALSNCYIHPTTSQHLYSVSSQYFLTYISQSRRMNSSSKTLIVSSMALPNIISSNLTATLSEHYQIHTCYSFKHLLNSSTHRSNKYERNRSKFDQENFTFDDYSIGWNNSLLVPNMNVEHDSLLNTSEKSSTNKLKFKE